MPTTSPLGLGPLAPTMQTPPSPLPTPSPPMRHLAEMEQVGVVHERHHRFRFDELLQTIRENSLRDMLAHVKWVLTGK